jgi:hypothetical protein
MKNFSVLCVIIFISILSSCTDKSIDSAKVYPANATGILKNLGHTNYQYGTHLLVDENSNISYALKSDSINLDLYANIRVKVYGEFVNGYPVNNGPKLLNVKKVE